MMKRFVFILMLVSLAQLAPAQETNRNQISAAPDSARFEIVQSELGVMITLKIDKHEGEIFLLVDGATGLSWRLMAVQKHPQDKVTRGKVNYQIFTSGLGVKYTFLLNVNTGATWQLTEEPKKRELFWAVL